MTYQTVSTIVALVFLTLCLTLVALPELIYWLFHLDQNMLGDFLAKRAGMLFLGLSVLCFLSRNTTSPEVIRLVSASVATAMAAMALLGIYEVSRGNAGLGILVAILAELAIAGLLFRFWKQA